MKSKVFLTFSVVVSLSLGLALGYMLWKPNEPAGDVLQAAEVGSAAATPVSLSAPAPSNELPATNGETFDWTKVESSDYKQYIANLRAIGCPEETIRDIIVADVNKLFAARAKTERGATNRFEYWKGGNPLANLFNEETIARQQEIAKEKRDLLVTLLGADVQKEVGSSMASAGNQIYETMLDFVPAAKQNELIQLEERFAGKMMGTLKKATQGDMSAMRALQSEKDEELLKILTPDEKFQYDLRMSQSAMLMRMQMGDLELTENEFQEVFKLRKQVDDEFGIEGMGALNKADQEKRDAARKAMNEQLKGTLGERYPEYKYELGGDWAAKVMHQVAGQNKVPREKAMQAYMMTDAARAQADQIKANNANSPARQEQLLQAIHDETVRSASGVLGNEAATEYFKRITLIPGFKPEGKK